MTQNPVLRDLLMLESLRYHQSLFINSGTLRPSHCNPNLQIPTIDLGAINTEDAGARAAVIEQVRAACENWGFFQLVNHGIRQGTLREMLDGVRRFHEQDSDVKQAFYSRDYSKEVIFNSNFDLFVSRAAYWRDTLSCAMAPHPPETKELPSVCRDIIVEYTKEVTTLGLTLFELMSEALGLNPNNLKGMGCTEGIYFLGHYHPACPEPELTMANGEHTDSGFLTVLLQDHIGGLQVLYENQWVDVAPVLGSLVVNIGDLIQLVSNDKFKSVKHRVLANRVGPRVSAACVFRTHVEEGSGSRMFGPIEEPLSEENPPIYRSFSVQEIVALKYSKGNDGSTSRLAHFKL
ncbi:hypothetical protein HS088_TW14G00910 [Tripterygium wilfordii]|uniref:Fe2OG dioxygenase domain-containing protein n=1 Tax=Tripterygium wilfordii TaxID=458696 RepID=A0A7J7CRM6_TRIWF|nr:hypothetical protein HS088_TW14G00910 [Tripterygium wilfordii]